MASFNPKYHVPIGAVMPPRETQLSPEAERRWLELIGEVDHILMRRGGRFRYAPDGTVSCLRRRRRVRRDGPGDDHRLLRDAGAE